MDGATEVGGADVRRQARAAVEIDAGGPAAWKIRPGMVRRRVGVFEGNAVEGHRVLSVLKSAEERLALAQPDPIRIETERAGRVIDDFGVISYGRHEILTLIVTVFSRV